MTSPTFDIDWLALVIGNSRLHWARVRGDRLLHTWETAHLCPTQVRQLIASQFDFSRDRLAQGIAPFSQLPDLWIASVVPTQTALWRDYLFNHWLTLEHIPIQNLYSTLGIDRALALWGAIVTVGSPVLVIDAGTALTFTAATGDRRLIGGAILPGLRLQFQALGLSTAALPILDPQDWHSLPPRWAGNTPEAIASGIFHTLLAGIRDFITDWQQQFPGSPVILTGGDGDRFHQFLATASTPWLRCDRPLIFRGIPALRSPPGTSG